MKQKQPDQDYFSRAVNKLVDAFTCATEKWSRIGHLGKLRKTSFAAINDGDVDKLRTALEALGPNELYYDEKVNLVRASINSRNLEVFRAVIDFVGDPNFEMKVNYLSRKPGQGTYHTWTPLSYALTFAHAHDIAKYLASDPRTRVSNEDAQNASKAGMQDVADILEREPLKFRSQPEFTKM